MLDLARRKSRHRATAWLLALGLLLGQFALFAHQLEHELQGDTGSCALCLVGEHLGAAPLAAMPTVAAITCGDDTPRYFLPSVPRPAPHAFSARAPPALLPS